MEVDTGRLCQFLFDPQGGNHRLSISIVDTSPWRKTQVIPVNFGWISMEVDIGRLCQLLFDLQGVRLRPTISNVV